MKFTITIECSGEAFEDHPAEEVADVLRRLLDTATGYSHRNLAQADPNDRTEDNPFLLYDRNGQLVGRAQFEEV